MGILFFYIFIYIDRWIILISIIQPGGQFCVADGSDGIDGPGLPRGLTWTSGAIVPAGPKPIGGVTVPSVMRTRPVRCDDDGTNGFVEAGTSAAEDIEVAALEVVFEADFGVRSSLQDRARLNVHGVHALVVILHFAIAAKLRRRREGKITVCAIFVWGVKVTE
ncbi:uncharacterized protein G2W53_009143 [Senna tora]|uniref:Uncharacterized protein n=1 Tax=Senna tora TaxID=362788 RepID=A0A835C7L4_9FABA|nr:uncharacterized protein G2W53_009143 [Senna tora]